MCEGLWFENFGSGASAPIPIGSIVVPLACSWTAARTRACSFSQFRKILGVRGWVGVGGGGVCSLNWVYFAAGTVYMEQNTTTSCEIDPVLVLLCVHGRN